MSTFSRIFVATDFSDSAKKAVALAMSLAESSEAELTVAHVFEIPAYAYGTMAFASMDWITPLEDAAKEMLEAAMVDVRARCPDAKGVVTQGIAWEQLLEIITSYRADLLVIGTHGRRGVLRAVLGSVAETMVRMSPIPVLTVRGAV